MLQQIDSLVGTYLAMHANNQSLQRYLYEDPEQRYLNHLANNPFLDEELYLELLPKLQVTQRITSSAHKPLSDHLVKVLAQDSSPLVRQALFQNAVAGGFVSPHGVEHLLQQEWLHFTLAYYLISLPTIPDQLRATLTTMVESGKLYTNKEYDYWETITARARAVKSATSTVTPTQYAPLPETEALASLVNPPVTNPTSPKYWSNQPNVICSVTVALGPHPDEFWKVFLALAPTWHSSYAELLQSTSSILQK